MLFRLNTDAAEAFVDENVQLENWQSLGNRSFAVEHRYAGNLVARMLDEGLTVEHSRHSELAEGDRDVASHYRLCFTRHPMLSRTSLTPLRLNSSA